MPPIESTEFEGLSSKLSSKQIEQLKTLQKQHFRIPDPAQLLPTIDTSGNRPMLSGYTINCNRPQLRNLQSAGFFDSTEKLNPKPTHISSIEGNQLKISNINPSVTESDLYSILTKIGAIKSLTISSEKGGTSCAVVSMVKRTDSKSLVKQYDTQYFMGNHLKVEEIRPDRSVKYMKQAKYEWMKAFPGRVEKEVSDLDAVTCHRGFFPKYFPSPHRVKFTVRVSFKE